MHRSLAMFRMIDAILDIAVHTLGKHSADQVSQHSSVVRVKNVEPLTEGWAALIWIETENNECFRRPIIKYSVRPERPTSHMSEPFSFSQIKFPSLQLLGTPPQLFFSALAVLDVDTRSKPLHYLPLFVMKRYVPVQK